MQGIHNRLDVATLQAVSYSGGRSMGALGLLDRWGETVPEKEGKGLGGRIRRFREMAGLSQTELGEKLGVSYQQVQKYERGANRVSVETLVRMGRILGLPVVALLDPSEWLGGRGGSVAEPRPDYGPNLTKEERELIKAYREIGDEKLRTALLMTVKSAAKKH